MKVWQFGVLTAAAFSGCFAGSYFSARPLVAQAQIRQNPPTVRTEDYLFVPSGGLRMVNEQGRVLGMIGERNGSGYMILNSPTGPSVTLYGGANGRVELGAGEGGTVMAVSQGNTGIEFASSGTQVTGQMGQLGSPGILFTSNANGGEIKVNGKANVTAVRLAGQADGGRVEVASPRGQTFLQLVANANHGSITANGTTQGASLLFTGDGRITINKNGQPAWTVPTGD